MLRNRAFTLIELLVVIAIIGILASVVIASLNSARTKGKEAAIMANLKNMISQAELTYEATNNYSTACTALANMLAAINIAGNASACYSNNNAGLSDVNLRWGSSAKNSDGTKNWSVDPTGVVTWGTANVGATSTTWDVSAGAATMNWATANTVCFTVGGRLPSLEQLKALFNAYGAVPAGFTGAPYWSSTTVPSSNTDAYVVDAVGAIYNVAKTNTYYVRCIR